MQLPFDADQPTFDEWYAFHLARVTDPDNDFLLVDLNDMVMVFATARIIASEHPEYVEKLKEAVPEAVERAGKDLGIFMGVSHLAQQIGMDPEAARQTVFKVWE